jgi:Flp pilus assembly protein TadB
MSDRGERATLIGAGAAACAVCCAGPIIGFVAALGIGALAGALTFGVVGVIVPTIVVGVVIYRRTRRRAACASRVELTSSSVQLDPPRVRADR